jgi:GT2 family glycosyltransferase
LDFGICHFTNMDISIVILNYKSKGFTLNCIKSIKETNFGNLSHEIIVVDNNSSDSIGEIATWQYPDIVFIQNDRNLGMGAGNNVGIRRASGKYVAIMNPDTLVFKDTFLKLHDFAEGNPRAGVIGPKQYNPDKSVQDSCFRWHKLSTPFFRRTPLGRNSLAQKELDRYLMKDFDRNRIKEVDWLLGSFIFCRASALAEVGLFDERFFMYFEDTDLCRRMWQRGWQVVYYPEAKIIHNHLRQSARIAWYKFFTDSIARHHFASWLKYLAKWGIK